MINTRKHLISNKDDSQKRARILLRVSSDQQLDEGRDLITQRKIVEEYVASHPDWQYDGHEYFEGGVSGYKNSIADRDILQEAFRDAANGEYDILVAYKDDRIGRRMWEIGGYVMSLKNLGVDIYTVKDGCISPETDDIMGQMMLALRYGNAQKSSADTGMRVKDTAKKLVAQGKFMGGRAPYGYTLELSGEISKHGRALKHLVISPEQAEVVKRIYELSSHKEFGSAKIARILNEDPGYKNLAPNDIWKSGTITSILTNPIYSGYTAYNRRERMNGRHRSLNSKEWILSSRPNPDIVIIDENTWTDVQKKRARRRQQYTRSLKNQEATIIPRNDGMLSLVDVLHCGYCGCKMVNGSRYNYWTIKDTGERRSSKFPIYKCQNAWKGVPHNKPKQFRADMIEPIVYKALAEYIDRLLEYENILEEIIKNNHAEFQKKERELSAEQKKLEKIQYNIRVMEERIPEAIAGDYPLSLEDLVRNIDTHKHREQEQIIVVQQKKVDLQNSSDITNDGKNLKYKIPTWQDLFLSADIPTKRVLVNKLIERIDITKEQIIVRFKIRLNGYLPQPRMIGNKVVPQQRL